MNRDIPEQQRGLLRATSSQNGNRPDQVPFYGFMGNVSSSTSTLLQRLMAFSNSGCGQERSLVCYFFDILVLRTNSLGQFHNHREHRLDEEVWARVAGVLLLRL
jgi:hypothetical protein